MSSLTFIGTASAIGFPHIFCDCEVCRKMIQIGGKNLRARSSLVLDEKYRIDFSPDCYMSFLINKIPVYKTEHIFFTHSHLDHIDVNQIMLRYPKYNNATSLKNLNIYGSQNVMRRFFVDSYQEKRIQKSKIKFKKVAPYKKIKAGDLECWPILVEHDSREQCFNYIFKYNNKYIYIGYDQKTMPEKSFKFLCKFKLDIAVFEGTLGDSEERPTHMTFNEMIALKNRLKKEGAVTGNTKCFATHFSHHMEYTHKELVTRLKPEKISPAYDGLSVVL